MDFKRPLGDTSKTDSSEKVSPEEPIVPAQQVPVKDKYPRKRMAAWRIILLLLLLLATAALVYGYFILQDKQAQLDSQQDEIVALKDENQALKDQVAQMPDAPKLTMEEMIKEAAAAYHCATLEVSCGDADVEVVITKELEGGIDQPGFAIVGVSDNVSSQESGARLLLKDTGTRWVVIFAGQNEPSQEVIEQFSIPETLFETTS